MFKARTTDSGSTSLLPHFVLTSSSLRLHFVRTHLNLNLRRPYGVLGCAESENELGLPFRTCLKLERQIRARPHFSLTSPSLRPHFVRTHLNLNLSAPYGVL